MAGTLAVVFILGLIFGSFANVVVFRRGTGRSLGGRSRCLSCGRTLAAADLVPVLSWLWAAGRCRRCGAKVSAQYPLVELGMGIGFLAAYRFETLDGGLAAVAGVAALILALGVVFFWVSSSAYDLRHLAIPDAWSYAAAALALVHAAIRWCGGASCGSSLVVALLAGPVVALPLYLLWLCSRGRWMGLGDPKLALSVGWLLGVSGGYLALFVAVVAGALSGLAWVGWASYRRGWKAGTMRTAMPFGPFIVLGALVVLWTGATYGDLVAGVGSLFYGA